MTHLIFAKPENSDSHSSKNRTNTLVIFCCNFSLFCNLKFSIRPRTGPNFVKTLIFIFFIQGVFFKIGAKMKQKLFQYLFSHLLLEDMVSCILRNFKISRICSIQSIPSFFDTNGLFPEFSSTENYIRSWSLSIQLNQKID